MRITASEVHNICTYKPTFDEDVYDRTLKELEIKVKAKNLDFSFANIEGYLNTSGLKTITKTFIGEQKKKETFEKDELPGGAKSFLQLRWLQDNGFYDLSLLDSNLALMKGNMVEDKAIKLIGEVLDLHLKKNTVRKEKGIFSGEADIVYKKDDYKIIRDNKSPENWKSFRNKNSKVETPYYWQLAGYKYLYDAQETWLDYTLMETPKDIIQILRRNMNEHELVKLYSTEEVISKLNPSQRVKSYLVDITEDNIEFMVNRLEKAKVYYGQLDYDICMGIN